MTTGFLDRALKKIHYLLLCLFEIKLVLSTVLKN